MPLLTIEEVAEFIGVKKQTVKNIVLKRQLTAILINRYWRFRDEDLKDYLKSRSLWSKRAKLYDNFDENLEVYRKKWGKPKTQTEIDMGL